MEDRLTRSQRFQIAIERFITERRDTKLNGKDDPVTAAKYEYSTWLADAARRVSQVQAVTHVLKATHPDARGSSLYIDPTSLPTRDEIGSHSLGADFAIDIDGNAASLGVYKLLKLQVDNRSLLEWLQTDDPDLLAALSSQPERASTWATAFKGLIRQGETVTSHERAKQLYWCVDGDPARTEAFHLLQPLSSSSLVHAVYLEINDARFGEANKEARLAWRGGRAHQKDYREYRGLLVRKLGGSKPQNISQLNTERRGVNYHLSSLPPAWQRQPSKPLLLLDSSFKRFQRFDGVQRQLNALYQYFEQAPDPTFATRKRRERIERALGLALTAFGVSIRTQFPAGWTRDPDCQLPLCEQLWLDPGRAEMTIREGYEDVDGAFQQAAERQQWPEEVAEHFALWLNAMLSRKGFAVSDAAHMQWARKALAHTLGFAVSTREVSHG